MSKSKGSHSDGGFHQEYIASLRYRNDLPPPELPPKFLEIPQEGVRRFLTPEYASAMARREEPNIDVDAEGGMPIDVVGLPGLHLGDESAIMASENPPPVDTADYPLLMTLDQLRKPGGQDLNVTFLRRTQYLAAQAGSGGKVFSPSSRPSAARRSSATSAAAAAAAATSATPKPKPKPPRDDPTHIKRYIQKGFDIAYPHSKHTGGDDDNDSSSTASRIRGLPATKPEIDAWNNPQHPHNPRLRPVGTYPFIPDLTGFNDTAGFVQLKFDKPPVPATTSTTGGGGGNGARDDRMDVAIVVPSIPEDKVYKEFEAKKALHNANPSAYPDPGPQPPLDYDLYLPEGGGGDRSTTRKVRAALNTENPARDDDGNYTHEQHVDDDDGGGDGGDGSTRSFFRYDHLRSYSTSTATYNILDNSYKDVALTLFDADKQNQDASSSSAEPQHHHHHRLQQTGAYYYPVLTKSRLQPERPRVYITQTGATTTAATTTKKDKAERVISRLNVRMRDANPDEARRRAEHRAQIDSRFAQAMARCEGEGGDGDNNDHDDDDNQRSASAADANTGVEDMEE